MSLEKDRLAVAIGKNGETKAHLEAVTGTKITIDSTTGGYTIEADLQRDGKDLPDALNDSKVREYCTHQILQAINMGFNPNKALKLLHSEFVLEVIDLEAIIGSSEKKMMRIKGRLIGDAGKIRAAVEQYTTAFVSISRKQLALIGDFEAIKLARKAVNMIIDGAPHKSVLNFLQDEYQKKKKEEFTQSWHPVL